jgi:serine/threonine protein kinase
MAPSEPPTRARRTESEANPAPEWVSPLGEASTLPGGGTSAAAPPLPVIPGYRVVRRLGGGGMGEVYEVVDEKVAVRLALKMIRPDRFDADFLARFRQEIRAMMLLDHAHIARIYGHGEVGGCPFFTMKFFAGGTLFARRDALRADRRRAVELLVRVADAVQYLHDQGKLHRDLKHSNILLDESGAPYLSDFGLVKERGAAALDGPAAASPAGDAAGGTGPEAGTETGRPAAPPADGGALTRTGHRLGTLPYMAPEQACGEPGRVGPATDVWALGVILYDLLGGRLPFRAADTDELVRRISAEAPPPPTGLGGPPDADLDAIVLRCLAKDPAARYESAAALADALRRWLTKDEPPRPAPPRTKRRRLLWAAAAAAAAGLALLALAVAYWPGPGPATDPDQALKTDPDQALKAAQAELAAGRPVQWVGARGRPLWYRLRVGQEAAFARLVWDDTFTVDTQSLALAEVCPDPGCDRYRFEAEVRQNSAARPNARVGLYVMHETRGEDRRGHLFAHWFFTEDLPEDAWLKPPPPGFRAGRAEFYVTYVRAEPPAPYAPRVAKGGRTAEFTEPKRPGEFDWRKVAVDVTPKEVTVRFEGKEVNTFTRAQLDKFAGSLDLPDDGGAGLDPRGGLGFYVSASSASFRNVVVRPLPPG